MEPNENYLEYLNTRSFLAKVYRNTILYPRHKWFLNGRVLDVGCGIGDFLINRKNTVGIDINEAIVNYCKNKGLNVHLFQNGIFPFENKYFDGIIMDNVIEHIDDPENIIKEIIRVSKTNAHIIIGVPGLKGYKADSDHKKYYDEKKLAETLEQFGLKKIKSYHTPLFKSSFLSKNISQYCIYVVFKNI